MSSTPVARLWFRSHDCHNRLWGAVSVQTWWLSAVFTAVYTERRHPDWHILPVNYNNVLKVYSVDGWRPRLPHWTHTACGSVVQTTLQTCPNISAESVAVSDDSMSDETTSSSDVTRSDTRLHWSRTYRTWSTINAWSVVVEADRTQNTEIHIRTNSVDISTRGVREWLSVFPIPPIRAWSFPFPRNHLRIVTFQKRQCVQRLSRSQTTSHRNKTNWIQVYGYQWL